MPNFSKKALNNFNWNGNSNLTLTTADVFIGAITLTGDPNAGGGAQRILFLPPTQDADKDNNVEFGWRIVINDPDGFLTSTGLKISPNPNDTTPTPKINDTTVQQQITTDTGKIFCVYVVSV
jgi:hypothetical protein